MTSALTDPEAMAERLLDAASSGRFDEEFAAAVLAFEAHEGELDPFTRVRFATLFFDLAILSTANGASRVGAALRLLTSVAGAGEESWPVVLASGRLDEIGRLASSGTGAEEMLELLAYAPDPGTRDLALSQMEAGGLRLLDGNGDSRSLERLLHGVGASDAAYRLETERKRRSALVTPGGAHAGVATPALRWQRIALAGGHAQMRATAAHLLKRHGIDVVQIPSSLEAVRRERDVTQALQGCDAALLLVRQVTHSTSDQVRSAAGRLGIPVIFSNALSAVAIERQLLESAELDER